MFDLFWLNLANWLNFSISPFQFKEEKKNGFLVGGQNAHKRTLMGGVRLSQQWQWILVSWPAIQGPVKEITAIPFFHFFFFFFFFHSFFLFYAPIHIILFVVSDFYGVVLQSELHFFLFFFILSLFILGLHVVAATAFGFKKILLNEMQ